MTPPSRPVELTPGPNPFAGLPGVPLTEAELRTTLAPALAELDAERQGQLDKCRNAALYCVIGALVGLVIAGILLHGQLHWALLIPLGLAGIIYSIVAGGARNYYTSSFKARVLPRLAAQFGAMTYTPGDGLTESEFNQSNLYTNPDRYNSEDLFEGQIGATRLRFSEVNAEERRTRTDSKGRTETYYVTIFDGLYFIADFNKNFGGTTYVFPEGVTGWLGKLGEGLQSLGGTFGGHGALVKFEDPRFEQQFIVYSSDQTEARYILSSSLMECLTKLRERYEGASVAAAFLGGSVYLAISTSHDWFEPPALGTPLDYDSLSPLLRELHQTMGIVADLDLNTRIWSKT